MFAFLGCKIQSDTSYCPWHQLTINSPGPFLSLAEEWGCSFQSGWLDGQPSHCRALLLVRVFQLKSPVGIMGPRTLVSVCDLEKSQRFAPIGPGCTGEQSVPP